MTLQEPQNPPIADVDMPETEVIVVAHPSPVFVDSTGRRSRLLRRVAYGFGALCMVYGGLISVSLAGGPVSSSAVLPLPDLADDKDTEDVVVARPSPTPEPVATPARSQPILEVFPRREAPVTEARQSRTGTPSTTAGARPSQTPKPTATRKKPAPTATTPKPVESTSTKPTTPEVTPTSTAPAPTPVPPVPPGGPSNGGTTGQGGGGQGGGSADDEPDSAPVTPIPPIPPVVTSAAKPTATAAARPAPKPKPKPEPAGQPEPAAETPEPAAETPKPAAEQPKPVARPEPAEKAEPAPEPSDENAP